MSTKLFSLLIVLSICLSSFAQTKPIEKMNKDGVYLAPDVLPEYPGGQRAMQQYIAKNIKYPKEAMVKNIEGRVLVQFVVMEDGSLDGFKVVMSAHPLLDEEAVRVIKSMPKWIPGTDEGKVVKVRYNIPIKFNSQGNQSPINTFPEVTVPIGHEIQNKSMIGAWQRCFVLPGEHDYQVKLAPALKILSADHTFMHIILNGEDGKSGSLISAYGDWYMPSDDVCVETLSNTEGTIYPKGTKNEINIERLHDNLIKLSYFIPGLKNGKEWIEYWYRVPIPKTKAMAE